mgnify:CR=1 FL=1
MDHQHSIVRKFAKRWFGPYEVLQIRDNGTYQLRKLDGTILRTPLAGKAIKIFKKHSDAEPYTEITDSEDVEEVE